VGSCHEHSGAATNTAQASLCTIKSCRPCKHQEPLHVLGLLECSLFLGAAKADCTTDQQAQAVQSPHYGTRLASAGVRGGSFR
jgi:hypothetical protein